MTDRRAKHTFGRLLSATAAVLFAACGGPKDDPCVSVSPDSCSPLYAPEFSEVFARTLRPTCGQAGSSCHSPQGAKGGLVIDEPTTTHARLLGGEHPFVEPGNASCSLVVRRLENSDPARTMPPGRRLAPEERCAIVQWIQRGAKP